MNEKTLRKITVTMLFLGLSISIPTQLAYFKASQNQWIPPWSFLVYMSGFVLFFIGLGIGFFVTISARHRGP